MDPISKLLTTCCVYKTIIFALDLFIVKKEDGPAFSCSLHRKQRTHIFSEPYPTLMHCSGSGDMFLCTQVHAQRPSFDLRWARSTIVGLSRSYAPAVHPGRASWLSAPRERRDSRTMHYTAYVGVRTPLLNQSHTVKGLSCVGLF